MTRAIRLCQWTDIAEGSGKQFRIDQHEIFVVKKNDAIFAYHNRCPHLGVELQWLPDQLLDFDAELIQCATHGALFIIEDGECVAGPCRGKTLQAIACERRDQSIWLLHSPSDLTHT